MPGIRKPIIIAAALISRFTGELIITQIMHATQKIIPPRINDLICKTIPEIKVAAPNEICISGVISYKEYLKAINQTSAELIPKDIQIKSTIRFILFFSIF